VLALAAFVAVTTGACYRAEPIGPDLRAVGGFYSVTRVSDAELPVRISTSYATGTLLRGFIDVDPSELDFRGELVTRLDDGTTRRTVLRGHVSSSISAPFDSVELVTLDGRRIAGARFINGTLRTTPMLELPGLLFARAGGGGQRSN
jgi:hypothetical protein